MQNLSELEPIIFARQQSCDEELLRTRKAEQTKLRQIHAAHAFRLESERKLGHFNFAEMTDFKLKRFDALLSALTTLHGDDLIDKAYTLALETAITQQHLELMVTSLHRKWLAESNFAPVAVRLCLRLRDLKCGEMSFTNLIYGMIHQDYVEREVIRNSSRQMFSNSVHFTFEFFRWFRQTHNGLIFNVLIDPIIDFLFLLAAHDASSEEIEMFHYAMFVCGPLLESLSPSRIRELMIQVRRRLVDTDGSPRSRALLLELIEIQSSRWNTLQLQKDVPELYRKHRPADYEINRGIYDRI